MGNSYNVLEWLEKAGYMQGRGCKSAYTRISKNIGLEKQDNVDKEVLIKILKECPNKVLVKKLISSLDDNQNNLLILNEEPVDLICPNPNNIKCLQRVFYMEEKGYVDQLTSSGTADVLMLSGMFEGKTLNLQLSKLTPREAEEKVWEVSRVIPINPDAVKKKRKTTKKK